MESRIPRVGGTRRSEGDTQVSHVPAQMSQSRQFTEGMVREILTSSTWFREMIEQTARGLFEPKVKEIHTELLNLKANLSALRTDIEPLCSNSWQQEIYRLDRDIDALRDFVKRSSEAISQEMAQVVGKSSEDALNPRVKPEDVVDKISDQDRRGARRSRSPTKKTRKYRGKKSRGRVVRSRRDFDSSEDESESFASGASDAESESDSEDIRVADRSCRKAMSVETYRLYNRETERSKRWSTNKLLTTVRHLFTGDTFDGSDPVTVLHFLEEMQSAFNEAEIAEGDARHLVRYFLTGEAARLFKGLGSRDRSSYPRIIRWLLRTYVRETMLQDAREKFLTRTQRSAETELDYSKQLRVLAHRCGGMIPERDVVHRFVRGLQPAIRTQVQMQVDRDSTWPTVVALACDFGNAYRDAARETKSRDESRLLGAPRRRSADSGRTLVVDPEQAGYPDNFTDEDDELLQLGALELDEDGTTVGAIQRGSPNLSRQLSHLSISSGGGSSGSYRTAREGYPPTQITYAPPRAERRVMLPPGIPFPSRQTSTSPKQVCWGCGLEGHFLSECKTTDPRLIEVALAGLRVRKQERAARATSTSRSHLPFSGRSVLYERAANRQAQPPRSFPARPERTMLVKDDDSEAPASESHPAERQDRAV